MIRKLAIYYIIFLLAFTWGIFVGYKKVFPYNIIRSIAKEVSEFYKGGKDLKDISIVDKIKNDIGLLPSRHLIEYFTDLKDTVEINILDFDDRRNFKPLIRKSFDKKDDNFFREGFLLVQGLYDFKDSLHGSILIDVNAQIINKWNYNYLEFSNKKKSLEENLDTHPLVILKDGSIIHTIHDQSFGARIVKTSFCGDVEWTREGAYHHSISLDKNQNIWTLNAENSLILLNSKDGSIIKEIFIKDIIKKNRNLGIFNLHLELPGSNTLNEDPFHINDVEPLNFNFGIFKENDLLISFRNSNLIFIVNELNEVKWWRVGSTIRQHDPDWNRGFISVFDNSMRNNSIESEKNYMSRIINIDLKNYKIEEIYNGKKHSAYSVIKGNHQILNDKYILVTMSMQGRVLIVDKSGNLKFEFINKYNKSFNGIVGEAIWVNKNYFNFDIKNEKCN